MYVCANPLLFVDAVDCLNVDADSHDHWFAILPRGNMAIVAFAVENRGENRERRFDIGDQLALRYHIVYRRIRWTAKTLAGNRIPTKR
jgi:hypothetical protein